MPLVRGAKASPLRIHREVWSDTREGLMRQFLGSWTVTGLARAAGLSRKGLYQILLGQTRPSLDSGLRICRAMERSPYELLTYSKRVWETRKSEGVPSLAGMKYRPHGDGGWDKRRANLAAKERV